MSEQPAEVEWFVDELSYFRGRLWIKGWAFHPTERIIKIVCVLPTGEQHVLTDCGLPSRDVIAEHGAIAENCRFASQLPADSPERSMEIKLVFTLENGQESAASNLSSKRVDSDPVRQLHVEFFRKLVQLPGDRLLEIGSRHVTGPNQRSHVPPWWRYVGLDIIPGPETDVVGDAHELSRHFRRRSFGAVISCSVFEHLAMPWKAVIEINRVLKRGGLVLTISHQSFPLHGWPWDYFRFSARAWRSLFNHSTGFEILKTADAMPAFIVAEQLTPATAYLPDHLAYITSAVLARKTSESRVRWPVPLKEVEDEPPPSYGPPTEQS
jgi:hypothetical protein